jgi:hypothetical protein
MDWGEVMAVTMLDQGDPLFDQILADTKKQRPELSEADQLAVAQNNYTQKKNAGATAPQLAPPPQDPNAPVAQEGMSAVQMFQNYRNDPKRQAAEKAEAERVASAIEEQRGFATEAQKLLEQYQAQPNKMNLAPLLALSESWTGFKQGGYIPPPTEEQRMTRIAELQEGLRKAKGGVTASELQQLAQLRAGADRDAKMLLEAMGMDKAAKESKKDARAELPLTPKEVIQVKERFERDYGMKIDGLAEAANAATRIANTIETTKNIPYPGFDPSFDSAVSQYITAINRDVARLGALAGGDLSLLQKRAFVNGAFSEQLFKELLGEYNPQKIAKEMRNAISKFDTEVSNIKTLASENYGGYADKAYENAAARYEKTKGFDTQAADAGSKVGTEVTDSSGAVWVKTKAGPDEVQGNWSKK